MLDILRQHQGAQEVGKLAAKDADLRPPCVVLEG
jgi:hypothetical protein